MNETVVKKRQKKMPNYLQPTNASRLKRDNNVKTTRDKSP